ncbi:MAG: hypothetical protein HKN88_09325 [Gammaproteobacteria bacterium]|nr:hypothetical protein [Gammaproteobacteria bacterium]NNC98256.1 hypothetical protein [Gammaproteobacteria bacterium]NNM14903.1 hypothetical protein [Gammaproteobacteria bacterium]
MVNLIDKQQLTSTRIMQWITVILRVLLFIGAIILFVQNKFLPALTTCGIILATFTPRLLGHSLRVTVPVEFEFLAVVFIYASLFLGEVGGYYQVYWWWDLMLHLASGFIAGIFGFVLVHVLNENDNIGMHLNPGFVAFFAFLFSLGLGVIWELFEYIMDVVFGMNMTKTGLDDTMEDIFIALIGALVISVIGYIFLKRNKPTRFFERWVYKFVKQNPQLFKN